MDSPAGQKNEIYATVAYDAQGNIVEVRTKRNEIAREGSYGQRRAGDECPEGKTKIKTIETVQLEIITCEDTNDPCWYHNPGTCRWYRIC